MDIASDVTFSNLSIVGCRREFMGLRLKDRKLHLVTL
jgi:hypothetical protein